MRPKKINSEPAMSDATILISVENLINIAMGPPNKNTINYKMLQTVLHILARQLRMLETQVEIRISEMEPDKKKKKKKDDGASSGSSPEHSPRKHKHDKGKSDKGDKKKDKGQAEDKAEKPPKEKGGKGKATQERRTPSVTNVASGREDSRTRVGSIEVVTVSQFELLESVVKDLMEKAGPLPMPALPDNQQLRSDLVKGSASLTDTMQAMQVSARVQAAEQAIERMAGLLTQLAAAGALPEDVAGKVDNVRSDMEKSVKDRQSPRKSVAISTPGREEMEQRRQLPAASRASIMSSVSRTSSAALLTKPDFETAIKNLKDTLTKSVDAVTAKTAATAESASTTAKAVAEKLDIALKLNTRISHLYEMVTDYADQLSGFDAGLTTQMRSFQDQMAQIRADLGGGLKQLEQANSNAETAAVMELNERYEGLTMELDRTITAHQLLTNFQRQLGDDLHGLLEAVEMLREQKADRDEVLDGLRDKADNSRLAGLLTEHEFAISRAELEKRLELCYEKFKRQEAVWMGAIKDLTFMAEGKAEIMQLLGAKDEAEKALRAIQDQLRILAIQLGEPKAAILTRILSKDGTCGACMIKALMEPVDPSFGQPPPLPALRRQPPALSEPCLTDWKPPEAPGIKEHTCLRWVGGSHTLLSDAVTREQAQPLPMTHGPPTKKYTGYGSDGRLYMLEEELQPCLECNKMTTDIVEDQKEPIQETGAGDNTVTAAPVK